MSGLIFYSRKTNRNTTSFPWVKCLYKIVWLTTFIYEFRIILHTIPTYFPLITSFSHDIMTECQNDFLLFDEILKRRIIVKIQKTFFFRGGHFWRANSGEPKQVKYRNTEYQSFGILTEPNNTQTNLIVYENKCILLYLLF